MSESQSILNRLTALRERLEQGREDAKSGMPDKGGKSRTSIKKLEEKVRTGAEYDGLLDSVLRQLPRDAPLVRLPRQLTARAHRILEDGSEMLRRLRNMSDDLPADAGDPLVCWHQGTVALADAALRLMGSLPDSASDQLRLCGSIEAIWQGIGQRLGRLGALVSRRQKEARWIDIVAGALRSIQASGPLDGGPLAELADAISMEACEGVPIRFLSAPGDASDRYVACHGLNVAQVMARVIRHDPVLSRRPLEPILATLVHDVGMLGIPAENWNHSDLLSPAQARIVESHTALGAGWLAQALPDKPWLVEAARDHHERLDGTGYPGGLRGNHIGWLARLLSACDVYVAQCSERPHRPARDTRTALVDTLMLIEDGELDRHAGERLLACSMYPAGTVVELADGAIAAVVAVGSHRDQSPASRPVLAVLTDSQGQCLPSPRYLDLRLSDSTSIVRSLGSAERRQVLGECYPEFV
jgi:HD-GYP domain-containing protein (c-di-GMP phosphodiesterase class II)